MAHSGAICRKNANVSARLFTYPAFLAQPTQNFAFALHRVALESFQAFGLTGVCFCRGIFDLGNHDGEGRAIHFAHDIFHGTFVVNLGMENRRMKFFALGQL